MLQDFFKKGRDFLGVEYPIICGGMTWISDYKLVKAVEFQRNKICRNFPKCKQ